MMKKTMALLLVVSVLALAFAGCAPAPTPAVTEAPAEVATEAAPEAATEAAVEATEAPATEEAAPAEKGVTVGFAVSTLANPFFVTMKEGGEEKAAELGITLVTLDAQDSSEKQVSQIEDLISQEVDVLIVNPVDSDAVVSAVKEANDAGIPVVTVTRPSNGGDVVQHLDIDNAQAGQMAGEAMVKALGGKGKVAILEGIPGAPSAQARQEGFMAVMEQNPDIEVVASLTANYSREEGARVMEDILQANPELDGVYGHNDEMALGALRAAKAAGRLGELKIVGIDATDDAIAAIQAGEMVATVKQQPALQMATAVEAAAKIAAGETVEPLVIIPLVTVDAESLGVAPAAEEPAAGGEPITVGFAVSTLANPFFVTMKEGGEEKAAELGITLVTLDAQDSSEKQVSQIEDLISQEVDVLIVNPVDSDAVVSAVKEANDAGIPVVTVTRPSNGGDVVQHLDIDNAQAGQMAGEAMVKALGGKGKVAILEGIPGAPSAQARQEGFMAVMEQNPDIEVVASLTANYSREEGARVMEDILQANPELDGVYGHNDEMALGALRAAKAAGRLGELKIVGIDATDDAIAAIQAGEMVATVKQQPALQMATAVEAAAKIAAGETVEPLVIIPLVTVDAESL